MSRIREVERWRRLASIDSVRDLWRRELVDVVVGIELDSPERFRVDRDEPVDGPAVAAVVRERSRRAAGAEEDHAPVRGRLLAYFPCWADYIGLAEETRIVNWTDVPACDLWIGWETEIADGHWLQFLLSWIPIAFESAAELAISLCPTACLEWKSAVLEM